MRLFNINRTFAGSDSTIVAFINKFKSVQEIEILNVGLNPLSVIKQFPTMLLYYYT